MQCYPAERCTLLNRFLTPLISLIPGSLLLWYVMRGVDLPYTVRVLLLFASCLVLIYFLSEIVRLIEDVTHERLMHRWGGPPAVQLLRHDNELCDKMTKHLLYEKIKTEYGICLLPDCASRRNPRQADIIIGTAVKRIMTAQSPESNMALYELKRQYDLASSITAGLNVFFVLSVGLWLVSGYFLYAEGSTYTAVVFTLSYMFMVTASFLRFNYLPRLMKKKAFLFAHTMFDSFLGRHWAQAR